jgi:hypothetical protein
VHPLRLITWNCRIGAFRYKADRIAPLRPDVLVVQEVEPIDNVMFFGGEEQHVSDEVGQDQLQAGT